MAPEQARGETTDYRVDLFSLGSTLYATCAGHPPFRAETPLAVLRRVCDDEPRPLRAINPAVPAWLESIVGRLMAKDPARRFRTATEVTDLLAGCLAHIQQPLLSPPPAGLEQKGAPTARARGLRRSSAMVTIWVAIAVAAGTMAFVAPWRVRNLALVPRGTRFGSVDTLLPLDSRHDRGGTDEVQSLLDQVRDRARAIEADVLRRGGEEGQDPLSARSHTLSRQAEVLERDIPSGRPASADVADSVPNSDPDDRR
jgi:serine/threonine-protein kinase